MEWAQVWTLAGVNIALLALMFTGIIWMINRLDSDVKAMVAQADKIGNRLDGHAARIDQSYQMFVLEAKAQASRTDQLYKVFVDEMKAQGSRTDRLYEMFVDLLKEGKK